MTDTDRRIYLHDHEVTVVEQYKGRELTGPLVTVLMPVFNREQFLDEAIGSVIAQDLAEFEFLIVDDGSTDRTPAMLQAWAQRDPRIIVVTLPENQGIPAALNVGLGLARAPYVARFDSDDIMMPRRLSAQVAVLASEPSVVLVSTAFDVMDSERNYLGTWRGDEPHELIVFLLNFYNAVGGHGQVMYRRADVLAEGGYARACPVSSDYDLWVRLLRRGRIRTLPLIGITQREHDGRVSVLYAAIKPPIWRRIMRQSLHSYLGREILDDEIAALITVWRLDGRIGMAAAADRIMRDAYAKFCNEHSNRALRKRARDQIALQWVNGARSLVTAGYRWEAMRYLARAACWRPSGAVGAELVRAGRSLFASFSSGTS